MQSVAQTFVRRMTSKTEKKTWDLSERTIKSEEKNDVQRVQ